MSEEGTAVARSKDSTDELYCPRCLKILVHYAGENERTFFCPNGNCTVKKVVIESRALPSYVTPSRPKVGYRERRLRRVSQETKL
ncbi:MAG: hypothetical protein ACYCQJ_03300 [Nitrososphaerales archaeon]